MEAVAWSVPQRPSLVLIAVVAGAAGCGGGHGDDLTQATRCLEDNHARPHALPAQFSNPLRETGWRVRTFDVGNNDLVVVAAKSDAAASQAHRRLARAVDTVDAAKPPPQQRGRLVYVCASEPSPSERAVVRHCIG